MIAERQTTLWLIVIYIVCVGPTWLILKVARQSNFVSPRDPSKFWTLRAPGPRTIAEMRRLG